MSSMGRHAVKCEKCSRNMRAAYIRYANKWMRCGWGCVCGHVEEALPREILPGKAIRIRA